MQTLKSRTTPLIAVLALGFLTRCLNAEELADDGPPSFPLDSILDVLIVRDWNGDFEEDTAVLVFEDGDEGLGICLYLHLSGQKWQRFPEIAMGGGMDQWPSLSLNEAGSLLIDSRHDAIGRAAWTRRLVIAYRQKKFIVAGYEYSSYDKLAQEPEVHYQANYLTGKMILNQGVTIGPPKITPLTEWEEPEGYR